MAEAAVRYESMGAMEPLTGEPCLDLANTASNRHQGPRVERLREYGDLLTWGMRTGTLEATEGRRLARAAGASAGSAAQSLARARALREAIYRVLNAHIAGEQPALEDISLLGDAGAAAAARRRLISRAREFVLAWPDTVDLDRAWWPAAESALALLVSPELDRVKECGGEDCNWLFLDMSKNRSRRWCDMKDCGNRAKAKRHYARRRGEG